MKLIKLMILGTALLCGSVLIISCGGESSSVTPSSEMGKEYTSEYICPMHCEGSGSDKAGECPVCGMDYVKNEAHHSSDHNH